MGRAGPTGIGGRGSRLRTEAPASRCCGGACCGGPRCIGFGAGGASRCSGGAYCGARARGGARGSSLNGADRALRLYTSLATNTPALIGGGSAGGVGGNAGPALSLRSNAFGPRFGCGGGGGSDCFALASACHRNVAACMASALADASEIAASTSICGGGGVSVRRRVRRHSASCSRHGGTRPRPAPGAPTTIVLLAVIQSC